LPEPQFEINRLRVGFAQVDVVKLRERFKQMSEEQLLAFGKAAKYMCSPGANFGERPRECFVIQLNEAKAEWQRLVNERK